MKLYTLNCLVNHTGIVKGVKPTTAVIAEVDTLLFAGAGLTPENLLLTQKEEGVFGNNLELSFEGVTDTKVVLGSFALEDLDNLTKATGAAVNLGNILFAGQSVITDSIGRLIAAILVKLPLIVFGFVLILTGLLLVPFHRPQFVES